MAKKSKREKINDGEWEVEEIIHRSKGISHIQYYYKGTPALHLPMEGKLASQIAGYTLIKTDLEVIKEWIVHVKKIHDVLGVPKAKQTVVRPVIKDESGNHSILKGLIAASFSFYGKLFTKAEGRKVKLERQWFEGNEELLSIHDNLILLRNNFAAHSGKEGVEYVDVLILLDKIKDRRTQPLIVSTSNQPNVFTSEFISSFEIACDYLLGKVLIKINTITARYHKNMKPEHYELLYKMAKE